MLPPWRINFSRVPSPRYSTQSMKQIFLGFSYGFREGRSQHNALDALATGIQRKKVNWVLDVDIAAFFDSLNHDWLIRFVEHRIGDRRIIRLLQKWLKAGVMVDGEWQRGSVGTPQGATISPLLANIYLHYAFDQWAQRWRKRSATGEVILVRYADDMVVGFQRKEDAQAFQEELLERLRKFSLELHPEKTRCIEFGRFAAQERAKRGQGKPETFNFLGFTHIAGKSRSGKFQLQRRTQKKRMRATLKTIKMELRYRMHHMLHEQGKWLGQVVRGYYGYHAVPTNSRAMSQFRYVLLLSWIQVRRRRSQRKRSKWTEGHILEKWLPRPKVLHPFLSS